VARVLVRQDISGDTKKFTQERSLLTASSVAKVLFNWEISNCITGNRA